MKSVVALVFVLTSAHWCKGQFLVDGFQQQPKSVVAGLSTGINTWSEFYSAEGKVGLARETWISSLYASVNPIKSLRIAASIPYFEVRDKGIKKFQDVFVQAQYMPYNYKGITPFLLFGYGAPLTSYRTEIGNAIGQQAVLRGYGGGVQYTAKKWFGSAMFQYQDKNLPVPDARQWQLRTGYFAGKWFSALRFDYQASVGGSDYRDGTNRPFVTLGAGFSKLSLDVFYRLQKNLGVSGSFGQTLDGRNVGTATEYFIGIFWNGSLQLE